MGFQIVSKRKEELCNFVEDGLLVGDSEFKLIYRPFGSLYIVFCVDNGESELAILDAIQVFVAILDNCFKNVCELDIIFNINKVHFILNEMVMGGMVMETNVKEIMLRIEEQEQLEIDESGAVELMRRVSKSTCLSPY